MAVWLSAGGGVPVIASTTRGPEKPTVAPVTAQRRSLREPMVTQTPPVVGWSATATCPMPASSSAASANATRGRPTSPATPWVPPLRRNDTSGRRMVAAWAAAAAKPAASASPKLPPCTVKSHTAATASTPAIGPVPHLSAGRPS